MYTQRLQDQANRTAATIECITLRALETGQLAEVQPMLRALRAERDALRQQIAWEQRDTAWAYPQQPAWSN